MEGYPLDPIVEHDAGARQQLAKVRDVDAVLLVSLEVDPRPRQQIYRVLRVHVLSEAEFKIELPGGYPWWEAALSIRKCEPELNDLEEVHIAAQRLVVILGGTLEIANRSRYDPWEFSVHGNVGIVFNDVTNVGHLLFQVFGPHLPNFWFESIRVRSHSFFASCTALARPLSRVLIQIE